MTAIPPSAEPLDTATSSTLNVTPHGTSTVTPPSTAPRTTGAPTGGAAGRGPQEGGM
jgi:hypothetical protein